MKLTAEHLDFLKRVRDGRPLKVADRAQDKVRQYCRRHGLASVQKEPRRWVILPAGRNALDRERG